MVEVANASDGTGAGFNAFLDYIGQRSEINPSTAKGFQVTASKVLSLEPDPDQVDMRKLDVDGVLDRFETLKRLEYSPGSMGTYKSRFRQSVAMYLAWLDNNSNWKNAGKPATNTGKSSGGGPRAQRSPRPPRAQQPARKGSPPEPPEPSNEPPSTRMVAYDMPLRPDLIIRITLPVDLTATDAERVAAFVRSLAFAPNSPSPHSQPEEPEAGGG
jgi:hypothetical protein